MKHSVRPTCLLSLSTAGLLGGQPVAAGSLDCWKILRLPLCRALAVAGLFFCLAPNALAGSVLREVYEGIAGNSVQELTNSAIFPNQPTSTNLVTDFFEAPSEFAESYGQRMHGYVLPPATGNYTFWIASDDGGELWLSTDENPANKRLIARVDSWTNSREWTREANQKSSAISLQSGKAYYIAALQKEGGGGDNLAVRWLRPDGVDEGPIPATYLLPYGTAFAIPVIAEPPTNTVAVEGGAAFFQVKLTSSDLASFVWRKNGAVIAGANGAVLEYGPVALADHGASFTVTATNRLGTVTSPAAMLSVTPDVTPPLLVSILNLGPDTVRLIFSEPMAAASALNTANYTIAPGISVNSVAFGSDSRTVLLSTARLTYDTTYTLTINNVTDRAATPNRIVPGTRMNFTAYIYVPQTIGSPTPNGGVLTLPGGGFEVSGTGRGFSGAANDQFQLAYQELAGDFDMQARVANVTVSDPFVQAGLMARETLGAEGRFAAVFASSPQVGCFFKSRSTLGATPTTLAPVGGYPVNYPDTWLRLQRRGATLNGFGSLDGRTWVSLGSTTVNGISNKLYFGLALSSDDTNAVATARFFEVQPTVSTAVSTYTRRAENLGPSSRFTGLVFSEIMYHPPARSDGRNLEFVEVYNARSIFEDLTGWRISGEIDYRFPDGFKLEAGEFVVVAANPADIKAVYGIDNVLGPYTNSLSNQAGLLRLRNNADAIRLEVDYHSDPPWPAAADGAGHSLVLARPSYGENQVKAWSASERIGGSPGRMEAVFNSPLRSVLINEFLAHTDDPQLDFIELYNHSTTSVDLAGCVLTDDATTNRYRIPPGTVLPARGFIAFDQNQLGFSLKSGGETLYLLDPAGISVLDAVRFSGQENSVSTGRWPNGADVFRRLEAPTPGAANARWRSESVVINEIMYHPISGDRDDEFIELYNRGASAVDLSGWRFVSGIDFKFPASSVLPASGYLVVARNAARLLPNYPGLSAGKVVGDYQGSLADSGDRLALAKPDLVVSTNELGQVETETIHIVVAEATYGDGGRWGEWADGGGSSLELIDPNADPTCAANWADSDETKKSSWTTVSFTGPCNLGDTSSPANRFRVSMLGAGECLLDDIQVFKAGGTNLLSNGGFETGTVPGATGWTFMGNHSLSTVQEGEAAEGTRCLRVRGSGDGDTGINAIRCPLATGIANGVTATITAKVRWLAGWPEVLLRTRGNWIELPARMSVPKNLGSPGQANSRRVDNAGPALYAVNHRPALPRANQPVVVTCRVSDPDGIGTLNVRYRLDPSASLLTAAMNDNGTAGDEVAGDGVYSATLPARGAGTLAAFRIEATDAASPSASSVFPALAPTQECLVRWEDPIPFGNFAHYHLWSTTATETARNRTVALDNTYRDGTLVYGDQRVIYNVGFRDKGSPFHGGAGDFAVAVPSDDLLLGTRERIFAQTGNGGAEQTALRGQVSAWIGQQMGIPYLHCHYLWLYRNGGQFSNIAEDLQQPSHEYGEAWYPDGGEGDLYKLAIWFEFQDDNRQFNSIGASLDPYTTPPDGNYKVARYRWNWQRRSNDGNASNYTNLFDLVAAANDRTANYAERLLRVADMEEWMRVFAFNRILGNWDSYTYNVQQNMFLYKRDGMRFVLMPWDIDFVLGLGDSATTGLFGNGGQAENKLFQTPAFRRMIWRAYQDAAAGALLATNYAPQIDARRSVLLKNAVGGLSDTRTINTFIEQRRNYILSQLRINDTNQLVITSNGGNNFTSANPMVTLTGTAPFAAQTIEINGVPYPVTWTDQIRFSVNVPLTQVNNVLRLAGIDRLGRPVSGAADTITVTYTGAVPQPQDFVVINEVHYNPLESNSSFIELFNRSPNAAFDLSGFQFEGIGYTFPAGALIQPNGYLVLAKNRAAFVAAYGATIAVFDEFPGSLDNGGEHLSLVRVESASGATTRISDVRYDNRLPWPTNAAGLGPSLQLIDPAEDTYRVANWSATAANDSNRLTPGKANVVQQDLPAFPLVWLNEVQPTNLTGPIDNAKDRDPWIELFNSGATTLDLSGLYLTDSYANLTKWPIPSGTTLGSKQFLLIWADGETSESGAGALHTNFRLNPTNGIVALVRLQGSPATPAVIDYLEYAQLAADRTFGSYPDGEPRKRRLLFFPTPGAANNSTAPAVRVAINEAMPGNTATLADPADGDYDDWFELFNAGTQPVDLTSYSLTDDPADRSKFVIPPGTVVSPGGFLLVWADDETSQNRVGGDLHVNFKLAQTGETLSLFAPDGSVVHRLEVSALTNDVSAGLYPDGADTPVLQLSAPSPGTPNLVAGGNRPPTIATILPQTVDEESLLAFSIPASDPDVGQKLTFSLINAPSGASVDATTGRFTWTPTEAQGPGDYTFTVRVADSGGPSRAATQNVQVKVNEVNRAPVLSPVANVTLDEGAALALALVASDADEPRNQLRFSLTGTVPAGLSVDPATGLITWIPDETQGPGRYMVTVLVKDDGTPVRSDGKAFTITVNEANNPPNFDPVGPQSVAELTAIQIPLHAVDPDSPPSAIRFGFDQAPDGARIDPDTGLITWTPTEAQGPANAVFVVRATEKNAPNLSSARTFAVDVTEVNTAPRLSPVADREVTAGETLEVWLEATDSDLPKQSLTFALMPGAPSGASLDAASGRFVWSVPLDAPATTNLVTLRVTDSDPSALNGSVSFRIVVRPSYPVAINEIMYRPPAGKTPYIELFNRSSSLTADLSGLVLAGQDFTHTFTTGTRLAPGAFVCVALDPAAFRTAYGNSLAVVGPWKGEIRTAGTVELFRPATGAQDREVFDSVTYGSALPWPAGADGQGASLQLIDARRDNDRVGNWSATASYSGPRQLVVMTNAWRYFPSGTQPAVGWQNPSFNDSAWKSGTALLYVETSDLPAPKGTALQLTGMTYYFRARFTLPTLPVGATLQLRTVIDDGAVFYLNGVEVYRLNMPAGTVAFDTAAVTVVDNATLAGPFPLPTTALVAGENVLAVEVHQQNSGSSDIVLGCQLDLEGGSAVGFTPGFTNSVTADLPEFPSLRINEVLARNATGLTDRQGEREPWLELINTSHAAVSLDGLYLGDRATDLRRWAFPSNYAIPADGFLVVFCDGEPLNTTFEEWHASFRLPESDGSPLSVFLARDQASGNGVVDYLVGSVGAPDAAYGRLPDGLPSSALVLPMPTPGASNRGAASVTIGGLSVSADGRPTLRWSTVVGRTYGIEFKRSLDDPAWQLLQEIVASGESAVFTDAPMAPNSVRFYRLRQLP